MVAGMEAVGGRRRLLIPAPGHGHIEAGHPVVLQKLLERLLVRPQVGANAQLAHDVGQGVFHRIFGVPVPPRYLLRTPGLRVGGPVDD